MAALKGNPESLRQMLRSAFPDNDLETGLETKHDLMNLWDKILEICGGVVLDKSPNYLNDFQILELIRDYRESRPSTKIIGIVRDPRDSIASEHELLGKSGAEHLQTLESKRLRQLQNLLRFQKELGFPMFRYEDLVAAPTVYVPTLLGAADLDLAPGMTEHFAATSIGRFSYSLNTDVVTWKPSPELREMIKLLGYPDAPGRKFFKRLVLGVRTVPDSMYRMLRPKQRQWILSLMTPSQKTFLRRLFR